MTPTALFACDGTFRSGFGHAARCLQVAQCMRAAQPGLAVVFQGEFSPGARERLLAAMPDLMLAAPGDDRRADVAFIDRMSDFDDIEACDLGLVADIAARCRKVLYLASGFTVPALPADVICLGYQPGGPDPLPAGVDWSLDYAPVSSELLRHRGRPRDPASALIAFGGAPDERAPCLAARAVAAMPSIRRVRVLGSPVNATMAPLPLRADQQVETCRNVPEIGPLLAEAGVVLCSFGNLGYEALALGAPLVLVGTKRFQSDLADRFAALGIATTAGLLDESGDAAMQAALAAALADGAAMGARARRLIDGHGIDRIANRLLGLLGHG